MFGVKIRSCRFLLAVVACLPALAPAAPAAAAPSGAGATIVKDAIEAHVKQDGVLRVRETIVYEPGGSRTGKLSRSFVTRERYDDTHDRLYKISGLEVTTRDGRPLPATVRRDDSHTTITIDAGTQPGGTRTYVLTYSVAGTINSLPGEEELRWVASGGWEVPVREATVTVGAPAPVQRISCFAGAPDSSLGCTTASMDHAHTRATFTHSGLTPGQHLTVVLGYPEGMTGMEPLLDERFSLARAFTVNRLTASSLLALLVLLLGGLGALYWSRGRDKRALRHVAGVEPLVRKDGTVEFHPPDGVRPGQIGTLIDEQADVIDVTATIVDLAVRDYLLVEELPREGSTVPDWRLVRRRQAGGELLPYERTLFDAIFAGGDSVRLSELDHGFTGKLAEVRSRLYSDVVRQGWFAHRPDTVRSRWTIAGVALTLTGVGLTIWLALTTHLALVGLAVIIGGAAFTFGAQAMPAKTARGSAVYGHVLGLQSYLWAADVGDDVPESRRLEIFSRYLPYAVIFNTVDRWARVVAGVGAGRRSEQADNLYWYEGPAEWDLSNFADSMLTFTMTASGAISATRQFRSLT